MPSCVINCIPLKRHPTFLFQGDPLMELVLFSPPLSAFDQDSGVNSPLTYAITSGNDDGYFSIDTDTGLIYQIEEIDREELVRKRKVGETDEYTQPKVM